MGKNPEIISHDHEPRNKVQRIGKEEYKPIEKTVNYVSLISQITEPSFFEKLYKLIIHFPSILKIAFLILTMKERMKTDMKTTISAVVQGVVLLLGLFGVVVAPELQTEIIATAGGIYAIVGMVKGYFTKDKDKDEK